MRPTHVVENLVVELFVCDPLVDRTVLTVNVRPVVLDFLKRELDPLANRFCRTDRLLRSVGGVQIEVRSGEIHPVKPVGQVTPASLGDRETGGYADYMVPAPPGLLILPDEISHLLGPGDCLLRMGGFRSRYLERGIR